jgi:periplasmic protein TonB
MTPSTHAEIPVKPETEQPGKPRTLASGAREIRPAVSKSSGETKLKLAVDLFQSSLIENNHIKSSSKTVDFLIAVTVNAVILAGPILAGLIYTDTLNLKQFENTFLIAPPPPPPPPPAPAVVQMKQAPAHRVFENAGKLIAPTVVPKTIADIKEAPLPPDFEGSGAVGGVPGGVAGGSMGGVIGGVIGGVNTKVVAPLAPKSTGPKAPVRVGGRVREPRLITRVDPTYPPLARQTHMQGVVIIDAILDEQGNVMEAKIVSGPPLLIQSALDAVKKWKYEPTYLNDQPVPVQLNVTVTFRLSE